MIFFSFSKKYRPFEHLKCHECLWCEYFDDCKEEFDYARSWDDVEGKDKLYYVDMAFTRGETHAKHAPVVMGEPIESFDKNSIYPDWMKMYKEAPIEDQYSWMNWMKTHKDDTYGKSVK